MNRTKQKRTNETSALQKVPPHDERAEAGLLGCILLEPQRVIDLCIDRGIRPESFYLQRHLVIFDTCLKMHQEGAVVDILTVSRRLKADGTLESIGDDMYLEELIENTPTTAHAEYYIEIVKDMEMRRELIAAAGKITESAFDTNLRIEDTLGDAEAEIFRIARKKKSRNTPWPELLEQVKEEAHRIRQEKKAISGIPTGFMDLDQILTGMKPGEMLILAARPSVGKTALALNIAHELITGSALGTPLSVGFFSLEMSAEQLARRMVWTHAQIKSQKWSGGYLSEVEFEKTIKAIDELKKAKMFIDDTAALEALELRSRARRMMSMHDISLFIVDYLQLMHFRIFARDGRQRETAAISEALKATAKELHVPFLVVSQLSRATEKRGNTKPRLSDLRDSGAIEQDADVVMLLRRPALSIDDEEEIDNEKRNLAILHVAKNRNGPTGEIKLFFDAPTMRFSNWTDQEAPKQEKEKEKHWWED